MYVPEIVIHAPGFNSSKQVGMCAEKSIVGALKKNTVDKELTTLSEDTKQLCLLCPIFLYSARFLKNLLDLGDEVPKFVHVHDVVFVSHGDLCQLCIVHRHTNSNCDDTYSLILKRITNK